MSDDTSQQGQTGQASGLVIPEEIRKRFPDLIPLVEASQSMNQEERQYWVNILPIMTPEQIQNLREILVNEKKQLAAIDEKYSAQIDQISDSELIKRTEEERKKKREELEKKEERHRAEEEEKAEDILRLISESS